MRHSAGEQQRCGTVPQCVERDSLEPVSLREPSPTRRERCRHPRLADPVVDDELGDDTEGEQPLGLSGPMALEGSCYERRQR
jgi:hypothetical protein